MVVSNLKYNALSSEKICYEYVKNLYIINNSNNLNVESNIPLEIESSMMLEEFCKPNNQGLLPDNFLKLVRLDSNIY